MYFFQKFLFHGKKETDGEFEIPCERAAQVKKMLSFSNNFL